jgi:hypothetical protein
MTLEEIAGSFKNGGIGKCLEIEEVLSSNVA